VLHTWLGTIIGETAGYLLTAVFTVLVVRAMTRASAPRWLAYLGYVAAAFIATGVLIPLGLDFARLVNFAGYVSWCIWLVAMAIVLWRTKPAKGARHPARSAQRSMSERAGFPARRRPAPAVAGASVHPLARTRHVHKAGWISRSGSARRERGRFDPHNQAPH
jgi:hypothetical protein